MNIRTFLTFFWLLCLGSKSVFAQTGSDVSEQLPDYFVGTFEDRVPKLIGGRVTDTTFSLTCTVTGACVVQIGTDIPSRFDSPSSVKDLRYARAALSYAKEHKTVASSSPMAWQAENLKPLLVSASEIETCIDLRQRSLPEGYMLLCKLDRDPWQKSTVLLMGMRMSNCGEVFCGYEIFPLFRKLQ